MKELFRESDSAIVGHFQSILESEGIPTVIRNEHLNGAGLNEIPIPEFFPALNVINDDDYGRAMAVLKEFVAKAREKEGLVDEEVQCPACGEMNPGNFDVCWSCEQSLVEEVAT